MSDALYERYKDALRRGHVAALRGRHAAAIDAYSEAAGIAPDRALPLVAIGGVLVKLGRLDEARQAYDGAIERSASDEGALRGRAELLATIGDRREAAETFDRLATALDTAGRLPDAADAARRALELAESRGRRDAVRGYVTRLREAAGDPAAADALARASSVLEGTVLAPPLRLGATDAPRVAGEQPTPDDLPADDPVVEPEPVPEPPPEPAFDPIAAIAELELVAEGDDDAATLALALAAATGNRAVGRPSTAIDACYVALAGAPADPDVHLTLAQLYLDQGWRTLAVDKLALLARLAELTDDDRTRAQVCAIAADRLPDEPRLAALCG